MSGTIHDREKLWRDFWGEMGERNGIDDLMSAVHLDLTDVMEGSPEDEIRIHAEWHIAPLECTGTAAKQKIIEHYGGYDGLLEFMAYNADWPEYRRIADA